MKTTYSTQPREPSSPLHHERLDEDREQAIRAVEQALQAPPKEAQQKMRIAKLALVRLRDDLIAQHRRAENPLQRAPIEKPLCGVNAALSLMVGVEYPTAGIQRQHVEQANELLRELF